GGTLAATGREMPSQQTVINVNTALRELIDELPNDVLFLFSDSDGFRIADIALDQTGKPVLSLGRLSLSRNSGSVFDITDADGFTVSVDDLTNRVFQIEQGKFVYAGQELQRSPENLFEITDVDGFSFAVDNLIERVANLEK
ncbi:hypothetical protein, partial [Klebsiella pneumoniae]